MDNATRIWTFLLIVGSLTGGQTLSVADEFSYRDEDGNAVTVEARLVASDQGQHVLELATGEYRIVPQAAVSKRTLSDPPTPLTADEMLAELSKKFGGPELFKGRAEGHFVVGLVLDSPLPKSSEKRLETCLKQATKFQRTVEKNFLTFVRKMRLTRKSPTHPLVLVIFETDRKFNEYHKQVTGGGGLSAGSTAGFYSPLSNWLAIRMTECLTFETPLHEAIHQQVFNQRILQRLAPTPAWFNEGIATGFEGNGVKISRGPMTVSARYSMMANRATTVDWNTLAGNDRAFRGDVFAGEAYTHAWCMHWFLLTNYKKEYSKYVHAIGKRTPLQKQDPQVRRDTIEEIFGKPVVELQREFPAALRSALQRQRLPPRKQSRPGEITAQSNLADVAIVGASRARGEFVTQGTIRNISLIRPMTFHVVAITDTGQYAEWVIPNLGIKQQEALVGQAATKRIRGARGGPSRGFQLLINSAAPDSPEAKRWEAGETPVPGS